MTTVNKTLTQEQLDKKKLTSLILTPIYAYMLALIICMLAFSNAGDRAGGFITFSIAGAIFLISSLTAKQINYKINVYYFVIGLLGILPLISYLTGWF